jgi:putative DNA methylase
MAKQNDQLPLNSEFAIAGNKTSKSIPDIRKTRPRNFTVPDFDDPHRPLTCLEVDFPIAPINRLAQQEGNAGKPIYQMSKWWARRRSSVFRSLLLAASTQAPDEEAHSLAAKQIFDAYYANHQQSHSLDHLTVLDPFMGGGTTLVEGARLGMKMIGQDLNPVAWFVVKNELAGSDPDQVKALFAHIEAEAHPQIQPFYTTTCPRGHIGYWTDAANNRTETDPITLPPEQRKGYHWHGPEVIYTFWAKHCPCPAHEQTGGYRTPVFKSPVVAIKTLSTNYLPLKCPNCQTEFQAELGATRMAPGTERVVLPGGTPFTEIDQCVACELAAYDTGDRHERATRIGWLADHLPQEVALRCPNCQTYAGQGLVDLIQSHCKQFVGLGRVTAKKNELGIKSKKISMALLIHPDWLRGIAGQQDGQELGGYAGASAEANARWYTARLEHLALIEIRHLDGADKESIIPETIQLSDGSVINTNMASTVPEEATCTCGSCGKPNRVMQATQQSHHTAPFCCYALQCYCPDCEKEGYNYSGRFFKSPDHYDFYRLSEADHEWDIRSTDDLNEFWPKEQLPYAHMTHERQPLPQHGYTHWWTMFNPRQLLVHAVLLRTITVADPIRWPLDVRMQALGAFQQYLRNQNMFCFWDISRDCLAPHLSNGNYHPKALVLENGVFQNLGRGNWSSTIEGINEGLLWSQKPWEVAFQDNEKKGTHLSVDDPIRPANETGVQIFRGSSTELPIDNESIDLAITDPPFGDNVFYADLADFFYVWLRIPLARWFSGQPEEGYFTLPATPKALEAITNRAEHPDTRTQEERHEKIPAPADEFYQHTLTQCWVETYRVLKPGGLLAFTFHHSEDEPWVNVLESLFDAGFILVATYPIRSDESKGDKAQFGSKKIEYDIIHVCRKRLEEPAPTTWSRMRLWVKDEVAALRQMLEATHKEELPESDIQVILRGKALEFYSRHYGRVVKGDGEPMTTREAIVGINSIIEDEHEESDVRRPPDIDDPLAYRFLRLFGCDGELSRDSLHKLLRGSAIDPDVFMKPIPPWLIEKSSRIFTPMPIPERFAKLRMKARKYLKNELDQAHFLIGAALPASDVDIKKELENGLIPIHDTLESLLTWYGAMASDTAIRDAAQRAGRFVAAWRTSASEGPSTQQLPLFDS